MWNSATENSILEFEIFLSKMALLMAGYRVWVDLKVSNRSTQILFYKFLCGILKFRKYPHVCTVSLESRWCYATLHFNSCDSLHMRSICIERTAPGCQIFKKKSIWSQWRSGLRNSGILCNFYQRLNSVSISRIHSSRFVICHPIHYFHTPHIYIIKFMYMLKGQFLLKGQFQFLLVKRRNTDVALQQCCLNTVAYIVTHSVYVCPLCSQRDEALEEE